MGVAYLGITLLAQAALPMVGLDPGILSNVSILSVLNVIFGLLHTEVYRKNPATGDWERQPANLGTRMGIAVIGLAFHSPLLLSTLNPIVAPLSFIGGNIAASLLSGFLHRMYNNLVVPRLGKGQVSKIAKAAETKTLLAANAKRMENIADLDLFYLERISRAITTEIRWLGKILEQA